MIFKQSKSIIVTGKVIGFLISYALFTIILFLILTLLHKDPSFVVIPVFTFIIAFSGMVLKRWLR